MRFGGPKQKTAFASIAMIIFHECRVERDIQPDLIADRLNILVKNWLDMEAGKSDLNFETFLRACEVIMVNPSMILAVTEQYADLFRYLGWDILYRRIQSPSSDNLLDDAQRYWACQGGQSSWRDMPILDQPSLNAAGFYRLAPVFRYALDPAYRLSQDNPIPFRLDLPTLGEDEGTSA
jgi:hypothetical protein